MTALEHSDALYDLASDCDHDTAWRLTAALWHRAKALAAEGRIAEPLPSNVRDLGRALAPRAVVKIIATVVATGFEYVDELPRESVSLLALARSLRGRRVPASIQIAVQATTGRRAPGRCVQFATATRVLFYALKRATGAPSDVSVVAIYGRGSDMDSEEQHAWNWLVDARVGSIAAFDVSAYAAGRSNDLRIDLASYFNASGFLGSVYSAAIRTTSAPERDAGVRELLSATIEPRTERGQLLLFHLADHALTPITVRQWIMRQLEKHSFERMVPDFQRRLEHGGSVGLVDRCLRSSDLRLLDVLE